jgi:transglutaminase-like putative cysteine protease
MIIRIGYELQLEFRQPTPVVFMLNVHSSRLNDLIAPDEMIITPGVPRRFYFDLFGNPCVRLLAPAGLLTVAADTTIRDSGEPEPWPIDLPAAGVEALPDEALHFLMPSRYCEVEQLNDFAWETFGALPHGWAQVKAILDWCKTNVEFGYAYARHTKTAVDTFHERKGVCRDFMHLAITLCRCLNIPARYATGYLGDIGVPPVPCPMDFSAFFEVYLGDRWWAMDARHNARRIGRILQARGRDAADVALVTSFGPHVLKKFFVRTDEVG